MFDLFRSRDKAVRYLLGALLGLVALSLVITLIPGYGAASAPREQVVAKIGDDNLTVPEVQATLQSALRSRQMPQEMIQFYVPQLIDQMITERAIAYQASRMGFRINDEELANAIRSMLTQFFPTGEIPQDGYARVLSQQGLTIPEFERNVRTNLLLLRLQNIAMEGAIVTPEEVDREYHRKNDKIKVEYVKYTPPGDLRSQVHITPEEMKAYFESQKGQFTVPEKRSFDLLVADEAKVGASFQVPDSELRAAYNASLDKYRTGERVHVRHILIKTTDKSKEDAAKAEAKANDLLKQIRGGADFAKLAKENSEDPGSAQKGGDLDWVTRGQTVPNFETAAFSLKPKEISNVIKTEYGYHILQVLEKEPAKLKSFDEVKDQIATDQKRQAVFNKMQQAVEQARAELTKSPKNAEQIASKYGLAYYKVENSAPGGSIPDLGTSPEVDQNLAGLKPGQVTSVMQPAPNKLAVAVLDQVTPSHPAQLAEVESQVRDRMTDLRVQQMTDQRVREITQKFKSAGGDLASLGKQVGADVKTTDFFTLEGAAEGIGQASYLTEGFTKPVGSTVGPFNIGNQVFLAKVVEKQPADPAKLAAGRDSLVLELKRKRAAERKELFEDGVVTTLVKQGKLKKYPETITRIVQGYRG